jgi:ABC-type transport system involved in multi-copper enzyme maturation permease subunit
MTWLLWKDYRMNRLILIVALALLIVPYALAVILAWYHTGVFFSNLLQKRNLLHASIWSLCLLQVTLALLGGNSIACERMDRSAEFLAYLPISRRRILASKLLVAIGLGAPTWILNLLLLTIGLAFPTAWVDGYFLRILAVIATTGLVVFCAGWFFSSMLESPTFAVCLGLLTPTILWLTGLTLHNREQVPFVTLFWWLQGVCLAIAAISLVGGTLYYLRRVEA